MKAIAEMYRDDIRGLRGALNCTSNALDDYTRRLIWKDTADRITAKIAGDVDITGREMAELMAELFPDA